MRRFWTTLAMGFAILSPAFAMAGDQEVAQQIGQNLKSSGKLKGYSINVKVHEGVAQLNGTVSSAQQLDDALSIAEVTPGIERVVNNLSVKSPTAKTAAPAAGLRQPSNLFAQDQAQVQQAVAADPEAYQQQIPQQIQQQLQPVPTTQTRLPNYGQPMAMAAPRGNMPMGAPIQGRGMPPQMMASRQPGAPGMLPPGGPVQAGGYQGGPMPAAIPSPNMMPAPMAYDAPSMPNYAWPSYASHPNYAAVTYPKQYSASAWPYIGPFYPYPQVPMGWRKVSLEWDDGWWMLDFKDSH
jgi:hypothetical protein